MPLEEVQEETKSQLDRDTVDQKTISDSQNSNQNTTEDDKPNEEVPAETTEEVTGVRACDDIRYDKFFKMKQFGVPADAVKLKMSVEGLDPSLLE